MLSIAIKSDAENSLQTEVLASMLSTVAVVYAIRPTARSSRLNQLVRLRNWFSIVEYCSAELANSIANDV